jgi:hypothetical protein
MTDLEGRRNYWTIYDTYFAVNSVFCLTYLIFVILALLTNETIINHNILIAEACILSILLIQSVCLLKMDINWGCGNATVHLILELVMFVFAFSNILVFYQYNILNKTIYYSVAICGTIDISKAIIFKIYNFYQIFKYMTADNKRIVMIQNQLEREIQESNV